ncbi:MAG: transketolase C-terminal domain-containing protein [Candidatus Omnitrophota bacterium]
MEELYARDIYGKTLVEIGKKDKRVVVLDADLSGSTRTSLFSREFPDRFFNFGVAEQNMMAAACGLASCGKIVFVSTFAMFAVGRAFDQIRNTVCYNGFNVKIVATHGGITVGEDGSSHQAIEDINCVRAVPNIKIIIPCDGQETHSAVIAAYEQEGPFYMRLGRNKVLTVENKKDFVFGKGYIIEQGKDIAIIANGIEVGESLDAAALLKEKGISATVANIHTIKPIDEELIVRLAKSHKALLVCEEHQVTGGLYSAVCEVACRIHPVLIGSIGINNSYGQSGKPQELMELYGLTSHHIAKVAQKLMRQRN